MSNMSRLNLILQEQAEQMGFETTQDALDAGYEVLGDKLYLSAEKALTDAKNAQLGLLDEVIAYFKEEQGDAEGGIETTMIDKLKTVEQYIKEN